jgi:nitrous oxide reductase accessory protein NosL
MGIQGRFARLGVAVILALPLAAGQATSAREKCPVCGMFVAKYPDWVAVLRFKDGSALSFDGPRDLFTAYLDLKRYAPGRSPADVAAIEVKDYYSLRAVDGFKATFVLGSDVTGPMGRELVPFADAADAAAFLQDHHGKRSLRFGEITASVLRTLP